MRNKLSRVFFCRKNIVTSSFEWFDLIFIVNLWEGLLWENQMNFSFLECIWVWNKGMKLLRNLFKWENTWEKHLLKILVKFIYFSYKIVFLEKFILKDQSANFFATKPCILIVYTLSCKQIIYQIFFYLLFFSKVKFFHSSFI